MAGGLAALGSAMSHAELKSNASVKVAKQVLDSTRLQGQQALKLIASAAAPPAPTAARGTLVNTYA